MRQEISVSVELHKNYFTGKEEIPNSWQRAGHAMCKRAASFFDNDGKPAPIDENDITPGMSMGSPVGNTLMFGGVALGGLVGAVAGGPLGGFGMGTLGLIVGVIVWLGSIGVTYEVGKTTCLIGDAYAAIRPKAPPGSQSSQPSCKS